MKYPNPINNRNSSVHENDQFNKITVHPDKLFLSLARVRISIKAIQILTIILQKLTKIRVLDLTKKSFFLLQAVNLPVTFSGIDELAAVRDFRASNFIEVGIKRFVDWYKPSWQHNDKV